MDEWVPFQEGEYVVERAFLLAHDESAVLLEDAVISVFLNPREQRQLNGSGRVRNLLLVKMLDDWDEIDLLLDLGGEFKYLLRDPILKGGKVFSANVRSVLHFAPRSPWTQIRQEEFKALLSRLKFLSD
ncbi:MAG: hypothetical protein ABIG67_08495 [Pseudomonadota bacterium]